jgi:probable rRNA maturation factor
VGILQISVFNNSSFKYLPRTKVIKAIENLLRKEKVRKAEINIVYIKNDEIKKLNRKYLKHNRVTDVIAFPLNVESDFIEGEIYIGIEVAKEQSKFYKVSLTNEILRLALHGTLHLIGYDDSTKDDKKIMHKLENKYIGVN